MYRLIIDTALDYSYLGILKDRDIIFESYDKGSNNHSETLMPKLEKALKDLNLELKDMNELYIGIGPGSYTGVRIAVVIGKMLAVMNNTPLFEVSSLALLASSKLTESYPFIDSRRGNAYTTHFTIKDNNLVRLEDDKLVSISSYFTDEMKEKIINEGKPNPILIIDSNLFMKVEDINNLSPNYIQLVEAERIRLGLK